MVVFLWRGETDYVPQQFYHKRIQISNFKKHVTGDTIARTMKKIFSEISFEEVSCERIYDGKAIIAIKLRADEFRKFNEGGLRYSEWPKNVKVRCLKRNFIATRRNGWVEAETALETTRDEFVVDDRDDLVELELPVENSVSSLEFRSETQTVSIGVQTDVGQSAEIAVQVTEKLKTAVASHQVVEIKPQAGVDAATAAFETSCVTVPVVVESPTVVEIAETTAIQKDSVSKPQWRVLDPKLWDPKVFGQCKFCGCPIEKRIYTKGICSSSDCSDMLKKSKVDRYGDDNYDAWYYWD